MEFLGWLYTAAPPIRRLTGSELSGAIQRFAPLTVETERTQDGVTLHLGNFEDEASLLVRVNEGVPGEAEGGEMIPLTASLYLLRADADTVVIPINR